MKTSIPSDVWEKKKTLIARLYKDEEWPLKQVIKQIRTEDFNPSETQLRSRLKKWRVTKPSRQTRKKPLDDQADNGDEEEEVTPEDRSPVETKNPPLPTPPSQPAQIPPGDASSNPEWYSSTDNWVQQPPLQPPQPQHEMIPQSVMVPAPSTDSREVGMGHTWASPVTSESQSRSRQPLLPQDNTTPAMQQFSMMQSSGPTPVSYPMSRPGPQPTATTNMIPPSYMNPGYSMSPTAYQPPRWSTETDSMEPDVNSTGMTVPGNWYPAHYDMANTAAPAAYYHRASIAGYPHMMQPMSAADMTAAFPAPSMSMSNTYQSFEEPALVRPWRRAMSAHYGPEAAAGHPRVDRQGRQRKPMAERKRKESSAPESTDMIAQQPQMQMQSIQPMQPMQTTMQPTMQVQYMTPGQHPMMSHDYYAYMGHDQLLQRPLGH